MGFVSRGVGSDAAAGGDQRPAARDVGGVPGGALGGGAGFIGGTAGDAAGGVGSSAARLPDAARGDAAAAGSLSALRVPAVRSPQPAAGRLPPAPGALDHARAGPAPPRLVRGVGLAPLQLGAGGVGRRGPPGGPRQHPGRVPGQCAAAARDGLRRAAADRPLARRARRCGDRGRVRPLGRAPLASAGGGAGDVPHRPAAVAPRVGRRRSRGGRGEAKRRVPVRPHPHARDGGARHPRLRRRALAGVLGLARPRLHPQRIGRTRSPSPDADEPRAPASGTRGSSVGAKPRTFVLSYFRTFALRLIASTAPGTAS